MTREEVIKHLEEWKEVISNVHRKKVIDMAIEALQDQTEGDLISRQDAINVLAKFIPYAICDESTESYTNGLKDAYNMICQLPSVEPKTGEWIGEGDGYFDGEIVYDTWYCSECDRCIEEDDQDALPNYCPNCGADMRGKKK